MSLSITLKVNQKCTFHPNPKDIANNTVVPGVGPSYAISDPTILSVDTSGPVPDINPIKAGATTITISGAQAPGQPIITEPVAVTVNPGPLDHFSPTADAPR